LCLDGIDAPQAVWQNRPVHHLAHTSLSCASLPSLVHRVRRAAVHALIDGVPTPTMMLVGWEELAEAESVSHDGERLLQPVRRGTRLVHGTGELQDEMG
jgi:hypothetical protein